MTKRIAMWSGPRNLSTAMMRSFGNRSDCFVWDEPFYGAYLRMTGIEHPMRDEILAACENDWRPVRDGCLTRERVGKSVFYQKHMTHHMLPEIDRGWLAEVSNVFLIRHPARVVASYAAKRENPTLADLGFVQQVELFELASRRSLALVVDAEDILANPRGILGMLCQRLGLGFEEAMLSWPTGSRVDDGVWGRHWYGAVERSTGFAAPKNEYLGNPESLQELAAEAFPFYKRMAEYALKIETN